MSSWQRGTSNAFPNSRAYEFALLNFWRSIFAKAFLTYNLDMGTRLEFGPYFLTYRIKSVFCLRAFEDSYSASLWICCRLRARDLLLAPSYLSGTPEDVTKTIPYTNVQPNHQSPPISTNLPKQGRRPKLDLWRRSWFIFHRRPVVLTQKLRRRLAWG